MPPMSLPSYVTTPDDEKPDEFGLTDRQRANLSRLCDRYDVPFQAKNFGPDFSLPRGYVAGMIGEHIYVGCSPEGDISS